MWKTILLFIALSPGMLLTLPPVGNKIVRSGKTCLAAAIVHGIIFALLLRWLKIREAFQMVATKPGKASIPSVPNTLPAAFCDASRGIREQLQKDLDSMIQVEKDINKAIDEIERRKSPLNRENGRILNAYNEKNNKCPLPTTLMDKNKKPISNGSMVTCSLNKKGASGITTYPIDGMASIVSQYHISVKPNDNRTKTMTFSPIACSVVNNPVINSGSSILKPVIDMISGTSDKKAAPVQQVVDKNNMPINNDDNVICYQDNQTTEGIVSSINNNTGLVLLRYPNSSKLIGEKMGNTCQVLPGKKMISGSSLLKPVMDMISGSSATVP